jgi:hypothetical protein
LCDSQRIQSNLVQLFGARCVSDQTVGHTQARDVLGGELVRDGVFENGAAETVLERVVFDREHGAIGSEDAGEHLAVEGLAEPGVNDGDVDAFGCENVGRGEGGFHQGAVDDQGGVFAFS